LSPDSPDGFGVGSIRVVLSARVAIDKLLISALSAAISNALAIVLSLDLASWPTKKLAKLAVT
jgi:hypothetical protein